MENLISRMDFIGVMVLSKENNITYANNIAKKYSYYFDSFIEMAAQNYNRYCLIGNPAEIITINQNNKKVLFIHPLADLAHLKRENRELLGVRQELNEVINSSFDGIVIADKEGIIIHQNPSYTKITGLPTEYCIGKSLQSLQEDGVIDVSSTLRALEEDGPVTIIQKISTGATVLCSAVPIRDKNGKITKVVNNVRDLTYLNKLEDEINQLASSNKQMKEEIENLMTYNDPKMSIVANSNQMNDVIERALRVSKIDSNVLIKGDSGVGKEKIVELIHKYSMRSENQLIKINCGAIPENLLESELFGYEAGSFTGASKNGKAGLFEAGERGTIFLDEIGEMPHSLQVKLLRVIQEREIVRIGGTKAIPVDIRIIAATHRDLKQMVSEGKFREDLYYRLNVIPISIPSLAERKEDIIPLVHHFLHRLDLQYGIKKKINREVLEKLQEYNWPGNVRELQNIVERVALMSSTDLITVEDLHNEFDKHTIEQLDSTSSPSLLVPTEHDDKSLKTIMEDIERQYLMNALKEYPSTRKAAIALKVDQSTLVRKMQKYNISLKN